MKSNKLHELINLSNKFKFLLGTAKVAIIRKKIHKMGTIYKFYATFSGIFVFCSTFYSLYELAHRLFHVLPPLLIFIVAMKHTTLTLAYVFVIINGCLMTSKFMKTHVELSKVCKTLDNGNRSRTRLLFLLFVTVKICCLVYEIKVWSPRVRFAIATFHLMLITIDLEIVNCVLEINQVTRCFEVLNGHLKNLKPDRDMEICDGLIINVWKSERFIINKVSLKNLTISYGKLVEIVNDYRSLYGGMVRFKKYRYILLLNCIIMYFYSISVHVDSVGFIF